MKRARGAASGRSPFDLPMVELSTDPLAPLVRAALTGDRRAERELVCRLSEPLRRRLRALLDSDADVEDALQESLLSVLGALPGYRSEATVLTYALRIGVLNALSRRRLLGRRRHRYDQLVLLESPLLPGSTSSDPSWMGMRATLEQALGNLPVLQAEAFVQHVALERSPSEIAASGGISVHTVRTRLRRALKSLRRQFDGELPPARRAR